MMIATRERAAASAVLPEKKGSTPLLKCRTFPPLRPLIPIFLVLLTIRLYQISAGVPSEGNLHSLWLMSGFLSQLKQAGFNPPDPALFNTHISSISSSLSSQARSAAALADFLQSKRRESYVAHATLPLSQAQKRELLVSPGSASGLFDQSLLEKISSQVKEDSFISSSLSMDKMAQSRPFGGGKSSSSLSGSSGSSSQAGPSGYQSPMFQRSASNKCSASPGRGGGPKRFKGARVRLLLRNLVRVFNSGCRIPVLPLPAAVCPSIGRLGGTGARILGRWRFSGWGTVYPFCGFLHCPGSPSPWLLIPHRPPRGSLWRR